MRVSEESAATEAWGDPLPHPLGASRRHSPPGDLGCAFGAGGSRVAVAFVCLAVAAGTRAAWAQPGPERAGPLSLVQALQAAEHHAPDLAVVEARLRAAAEAVPVAGLLANPRVTLGTTARSTRFSSSVFLALPLFGQRGAAIENAEAQRTTAVQEAAVTRGDVRLAVASAWVDLWLAEREAETAAETAARRQRLLAVAEEQLRAGSAPRLNVLRARAEARRSEAAAAASRRLVQTARARLAVWLGPAGTASLATRSSVPPPRAIPALAGLLARLEEHPVLRRALARESAARAAVAVEQRARWPLVGLEVGTGLFNRESPTHDAFVAVSFEVPLFHLRGPALAQARALRVAAQLEVERVRVELRAKLAAAHAALQAAVTRERAQQSEVLPAAQKAAVLALEGYEAGALDLTSVLAVEQSLTEARLATWRAVAERVRAEATLTHAVGGVW
jgi:cobalt-zinc-cadmium efflux system outer membrane protein